MRVIVWLSIFLSLFHLAAFGSDSSYPDKSEYRFAVAPYLLDVKTDSAIVAFHLNTPMIARVNVFQNNEKKTFHSTEKNTSHFVKITGLEPGLTYSYEVICDDGRTRTPKNDFSYQIKTACSPGKSFVFAVYGDPRPGDSETNRYHRDIIDQINTHEPAFSLVLGDMVDSGELVEQWEEFFQIESPLLKRSAIYPVLGDNDFADGKGVADTYFPELKKGYYRFEWGGVQFFGLNAWDTKGIQDRDEIDADSNQVQWLVSELSKQEVQEAPFRVVFLHDPVYISRGRSSEILRRVWAPILREYRVDVVFASWHIYERLHQQGVTYIISGGAGAEIIWMSKNPAYPSQAEARQHHFCRVDVNSGAMTIRAVAVDGTVLDEIVLTSGAHESDTDQPILKREKLLGEKIIINPGTPYPDVPLYLFSFDCSYCRKLIQFILPRLAKKHNVTLNMLYFDLGKKGTYDLFLNAGAEFGRQGSDIPAIFIGRSVFGGETEIEKGLSNEIKKFLDHPQNYLDQMIVPFSQTIDTKTIGENVFNTLTVGIVIGAGLLDGINPCAFTTIIFLISYLSLFGVSRRKMIYIGTMYTLGVFLAYFVIGLVFYNYLKTVLTNQTFSTIINSVLLLAVVLLAVFSFIDFIRCLKGRTTDITLKLSNFFKINIQEKIRKFSDNKMTMIGAPFVLGIFISGMELTCTGQVYIPIVAMISEPRHRVAALTYLLTYNVAFILPLIVVFTLAVFGITSGKIGKGKKYMVTVKMGHVVFFSIMAVIIMYNLGWI